MLPTLPLALLVCAAGATPTRAAIAIRDDVPGYQKLATEQYTVPELSGGYDKYWYFTEGVGTDQHSAFVDAVRAGCRGYDVVDVFLLTHGRPYVDWVEEVPARERACLRLVYNTGAGGSREGAKWISLGAKAYVGHPGGNVAPVFYVYFLPAWLKGLRLADVVDGANERTREHLYGVAGSALLTASERDSLWAGTQAQLFGDTSLHH